MVLFLVFNCLPYCPPLKSRLNILWPRIIIVSLEWLDRDSYPLFLGANILIQFNTNILICFDVCLLCMTFWSCKYLSIDFCANFFHVLILSPMVFCGCCNMVFPYSMWQVHPADSLYIYIKFSVLWGSMCVFVSNLILFFLVGILSDID